MQRTTFKEAAAIEVRELAKSFEDKTGTVEAVRGLTFDVAPGELVAFLGIAAMSYAIASKRDGSRFYLVTHSVTLPLMLLGGVLLPMDLAPRWLHLASRANPLTYLVEAERTLFTGTVADASVALGTLVAVTVAALGLALGTIAIRKASV